MSETGQKPSPATLATIVAARLRDRASEAQGFDLPEVSAGFESMAVDVEAAVAELLALSESLASANEEVARLREERDGLVGLVHNAFLHSGYRHAGYFELGEEDRLRFVMALNKWNLMNGFEPDHSTASLEASQKPA